MAIIIFLRESGGKETSLENSSRHQKKCEIFFAPRLARFIYPYFFMHVTGPNVHIKSNLANHEQPRSFNNYFIRIADHHVWEHPS